MDKFSSILKIYSHVIPGDSVILTTSVWINSESLLVLILKVTTSVQCLLLIFYGLYVCIIYLQFIYMFNKYMLSIYCGPIIILYPWNR